MEVKQFEDKNLAHYSYAIISEGKMAVIDPSRNPQPYYDFAEKNNAQIIAVIETHPHADFVSSHLEIHKTTGATIYTSSLTGAHYPHTEFDDGDTIKVGAITLRSINTPGHSPDSISVILLDKEDVQKIVFTGDTLFIGDCGRPDLRKRDGLESSKSETLARQMYHSLREKLLPLPDSVLVYPAHGAGSLCGKGMSDANSSTMGQEKISNWSLQEMTEEEFMDRLLMDQPFIPKYFSYNVSLNKKGAPDFAQCTAHIEISNKIPTDDASASLNPDFLIIDSRPEKIFKKGHLPGAINLMAGLKFETWLGSIVGSNEKFYLIGSDENALKDLIERTAKIGYECNIARAFADNHTQEKMPDFNGEKLRGHEEDYTIIDVRNETEVKDAKTFDSSINIPLHQLRERINEIPLDKPVVVHCAAGYRSAVGSSIVKAGLNEEVQVYDLGEEVKGFKD